MTDEDRPKKPDVNATIQLDQIDADQITFPDSAPSHRVVPPPLPPEVRAHAQSLPVQPSVRPPKPKPKPSGKTIALVGAFVVLLVLVIVGGLKVGSLVRGDAPAASSIVAAPSAPPATAPAPSPSISAAAPVQTITIPTIEMR